MKKLFLLGCLVGSASAKTCYWSSWSSCSKTCGGATITRKFITNGNPLCLDKLNKVESQPCATEPCATNPLDCVGSFQDWTTCSKSCGGGEQKRTYNVYREPQNGGQACPLKDDTVETQKCNEQACPINCVGSWGQWGSCSRTCNGGTQSRSYTVTLAAAFGGKGCEADDKATGTQACNTNPCPVDCVGAWSPFGTCSATCGGGKRTKTFTVGVAAAFGGKACAAKHQETSSESCSTTPCPVDCIGKWGTFNTCTKTCGTGTQTRKFDITQKAANGGKACEATDDQISSQMCNTQDCPVDCLGDWGAFGACSASCGKGTQSRAYEVMRPAAFGGKACPSAHGATSTQHCNTQGCPVDCIGDFGAWGTCSDSCGTGSQTRVFAISRDAANGGKACSSAKGAKQTQACNTQPCPINCVGAYGPFGACSASCGSGKQTRRFSVSVIAQFGGNDCTVKDGAESTQACNTHPCPVDCIGAWGNFGSCTKSCGVGGASKVYSVSVPAAYGGAACPFKHGLTETVDCNTEPCATDCVGGWTSWSKCSKSCQGGVQTRDFNIKTLPINGGKPCENVESARQSQVCNTDKCPKKKWYDIFQTNTGDKKGWISKPIFHRPAVAAVVVAAVIVVALAAGIALKVRSRPQPQAVEIYTRL